MLSRRFVTRDLLLKLISNNLCDKKIAAFSIYSFYWGIGMRDEREFKVE